MIRVIKKIWDFSGAEKTYIRKSLLADFLAAIFNMLQFIAIYIAIDSIINQHISYKTILVSSLFLVMSVVGVIAMKKSSMLMQTHAGYFMASDKRIYLGEKIKNVPMGFFSDFSLGKLTTIATTDLDNLETWLPNLFVMVLGGMINAFVFVLSLFIVNNKVGIIAVVGSLVFLLATSLMLKKSLASADKRHQVEEKLTKEILAHLQGMQVIKSYNLAGENNKGLYESFDQVRDTSQNLEQSIIPYTILQKIIIAATIACMLLVSIRSYFLGEAPLVDTILLLIASFVIFDGLIASGSGMAMLRSVENAIESYSYVTGIEDMEAGSISRPIQDPTITFNQVSFSYDQRPILKDITCQIKENTMTAIVGPSGSGKTTFCNLIARFWDVDTGQIKIGGQDVRDYAIESLMDAMSMVFQNVYLFEDTIENNIKFGREGASKEEVIEAAKKAQCHDFIMELDNGYQTVLGEGGGNLSGGQKQRISIARAMLKDAPITIFDEATANVDPENEDKLRSAIESLTVDKTVIMIAHRLKTIRNADQILVLNQGEIEQRGTHDELMQEGGLYKKLIQAKEKAEDWELDN